MKNQAFISLNEFNLSKVKKNHLLSFLYPVAGSVSSKSKKDLLKIYNDLSYILSCSRWLSFLEKVFDDNGLVFIKSQWVKEFNTWSKSKDYSVFCNF